MKLAGQGDGCDRTRIFVITCPSEKGTEIEIKGTIKGRGQPRADLVVLSLTQNAWAPT